MLVRSPSCVEQLHVLSSALLRESLPLSVHNLSTELSQDSRALSYLASVVLAQVIPVPPSPTPSVLMLLQSPETWSFFPFRLETRMICFLYVSIY